jgi:hypothetical protein
MGEWGPGSPSEPLSLRERGSEDEQGKEPEESEESLSEQSEADERRQRELREYEERFEGTGRSMLRHGEYAFLPVFGFNESNVAARKYAIKYGFEEDGSVINVRDDEPLEIGGKELTWWEDNSIMPKHPFMLVNPLGFASVDPDVHNFRKVFRVAKGEHFVFSDSGGYQLMSMTGEDGKTEARIVESRDEHSFTDYNVYPERLLEWQVANADAGATIDYPPYNLSGSGSFPDKAEWGPEWLDFYDMRRDKSAGMTERMSTRLREMRDEGNDQAEDYIFMPVIHGKPDPNIPHRLIEKWHRSMDAASEVDPNGWVLKPEPASNFGQIALHLGYANQHLQDADYIHVLMVGGLLQKTLLMYYAKKSDHFVTSDASSYAAGGKRRQFDLPKTATRRSVIISSRDDDEDNAAANPNRLDRYPCRCAVCSTVEQELGFEFVTDGSGSARSVSLNLHNLQQTLNVERTLDALLREDEVTLVETGGEPTGSEFWRYVKTLSSEKPVYDLYRAMDYVRLAVDEGLSVANDTYRIKWEKSDGKSIDRGTDSAGETNW